MQPAPFYNGARGLSTAEFFADPFAILLAAQAAHGNAFTVRLFGEDNLFLTTPGANRAILSDNPSIFSSSEGNLSTAKELFGMAFLYLDGAAHGESRRRFAPLFRAQALEPKDAQIECILAHHLPKGVVNLGNISSALFLRMAGLRLLNYDFGSDSGILASLLISLASGLFSDPDLGRSDNVYSKALDAKAALTSFWEEHLSSLESALQSCANGCEGQDRPELFDNLNAILWAAFDTCNSTFAFAVEFLGRDHQLLELLMSLRSQDSIESRQQYSKLLSCVFFETLRLRPPVYMLSRRATMRFIIDGIDIPEGCLVNLVPLLVHRSSDYYSFPNEFQPDRFKDGDQPHAKAGFYLPFGLGPKACIGISLGKLMFRQAMDYLMRERSLSVVDPNTVLRWVPGLSASNGPVVRIA